MLWYQQNHRNHGKAPYVSNKNYARLQCHTRGRYNYFLVNLHHNISIKLPPQFSAFFTGNILHNFLWFWSCFNANNCSACQSFTLLSLTGFFSFHMRTFPALPPCGEYSNAIIFFRRVSLCNYNPHLESISKQYIV